MALTESTMMPLGSPCPDFALPGVDGHVYRLSTFREPQLLLVAMCNHCPYVKAVEDRINRLAKEYSRKVAVVGVCANDAEAYPDDSMDAMRERAKEKGFVFPYLQDENQAFVRALGAVCTPDFFLFDAERRLVYRGRLDDNWKDASAVTRQDLREAIEAQRDGRPVSAAQKPSMGCSIKWKA